MISNKERKRRLKQKMENEKKNPNKYFSGNSKKMDWSLEDFESRVVDEKKLEVLSSLQIKLLLAGGDICEKGGEVIYSTCSISEQQNECILD